MTFLTVVTRHIPRRADMLALNADSLREQSDPDYQHLIIVDEPGRGVEWANGMMAERDWSDVEGEFVLVLDDDDMMADDRLIERLKRHSRQKPTDLFVVRMDHGPLGILPGRDAWLGEPIRNRQGCSSVIPSRDLFLRAVCFYMPDYTGDFDYVQACYDGAREIAWLDTVATRVQQIGKLSTI